MIARSPIFYAAALTGLLMLATLAATLLPLSSSVTAVVPGDKLNHMIAFTILAVPMASVRPRWILPLVLALAAFGALIEVVQPLFGRSCELNDWLADLAGIAAGVVIGLILHVAMRPLLKA